MCELSTADGFVEINESLGDMIKYVVNETSVGLYYIQQHAQNAVPNVIRLKNNVMEKSHEVSLHTENLEDSISVTRSMKECGPPVIDQMIRDIKTSLTIMSTKQPIQGLIQRASSTYQLGGPSSWGPVTWARSKERGGSYFSNVFKSAKEKAGNLRWPPLDLKETGGGDLSVYSRNGNGPGLGRVHSDPDPFKTFVSGPRFDPDLIGSEKFGINCSTQPDEADELPVSSQVEDEMVDDDNVPTDGKLQPVISSSNGYDKFKADREARLEEWLRSSGSSLQKGTMDGKGHHQLHSL